ncbi:MAG: flagellar motor protein MotB, partial [Dongiaceae bacterium]
MARKHKHEEHLNHEAWAIPYGDLITLLLAFFVVMYSMSSVNEGKYRVLADSLAAAFGGPPRSVKPVQFGEKQKGDAPESQTRLARPKAVKLPVVNKPVSTEPPPADVSAHHRAQQRARLAGMARAVEEAMGELIAKD